MPVSREEDEEFAGGTVEETGLPAVVVVVDYVGAICNAAASLHPDSERRGGR